MSRRSQAFVTLPPIAANALKKLGENLAIARLRRRESQRVWAQRIGVSVPTLIRLESGDAGVSLGVLATALWMIGRAQNLSDLAAPENDLGALEQDVRQAVSRYARRGRKRQP